MANLAAETEASNEEKRQPSPNSSSVNEDSSAPSQPPSKITFVPPPRMANLNAERQAQQQQQLYDPTKGL